MEETMSTAKMIAKLVAAGHEDLAEQMVSMQTSGTKASLEDYEIDAALDEVIAGDPATNAFKFELQGWLAKQLEPTLKELDKKMLAIQKGKWPDTRLEYAVTRHRPLSSTQEEFMEEIINHYLTWRNNARALLK